MRVDIAINHAIYIGINHASIRIGLFRLTLTQPRTTNMFNELSKRLRHHTHTAIPVHWRVLQITAIRTAPISIQMVKLVIVNKLSVVNELFSKGEFTSSLWSEFFSFPRVIQGFSRSLRRWSAVSSAGCWKDISVSP